MNTGTKTALVLITCAIAAATLLAAALITRDVNLLLVESAVVHFAVLYTIFAFAKHQKGDSNG